MSHENARASHETGAQREQHSHSSVSPIATLLGRLDRVRQVGPDRWIATCTAHEDRNPSLTARVLDDGRVLLHCFAGCETSDVLAAIGLEFSDLFPEKRIGHNVKCERHPFPASDVIRCLAHEASIVLIACSKLISCEQLSVADLERLHIAETRIRGALEVCNV